MARLSNVNFLFNTPSAGLYAFKELIKSAGWTTVASSDGTTYNASGDQITSGGTGAGTLFGTSGGWIRLQDPGGLRELLIQCAGSGANSNNGVSHARVLYSASARFTGGTPGATRAPTATDQQFLVGGGTDVSPTYGAVWNSGSGNVRMHATAESSPVSGVYTFCMVTTGTGGAGSTQVGGTFFCDALAPGSYSSDADPSVWYLNGSTAFGLSAVGWLAYGTGSAAWVTLTANVGVYNGTLGVNPVTGADDNGYPTFTGPVSGITRRKGITSRIAARGPARSYPGTTNRGTDAGLYLGSWVYPYPISTEPGVS